MGRARRAEKKKNGFKILLPILCIIIAVVIFYMIGDMNKKIEKNDTVNSNTTNIANVENEVTDNNVIENQIIENNIVENEIQNTETVNTNTQNNNTAKNEVVNKVINESAAPAKPAVTDQKQKAIELVKKEWGNDDSVDYMFDYINENGEYVIAVKDRNSATVKYYFRVNLETETVELD